MFRSLESTMSKETLADRRCEIAVASGKTKRTLLGTAHKVSEKYPRQVARLLGVDYDPKELRDPIGSGSENIVFRQKNEVIKVHKGSAFMSEAQRQEIAAKKAHDHELMAEHLGQFALPQQVYVGEHPIIPSLRAIQTRQIYLSGLRDTRLVGESSGTDSVAANLDRFYGEYPEAAGQLIDFVEDSYKLDDEHNLLPDTNGSRNLVIGTDQNMVMVDGQPVGQEHTAVQDIIRWQLESLASAHQETVAA